MTEEMIPLLEVSVELGCYNAVVRAATWLDVLTQARVAEMKLRVAEVASLEMGYDYTRNTWRMTIPEDMGPVRDRIALVLLLASPERVTRDELSAMASVEMGSLRNYLTKDELGVKSHIDENEEGLRLNTLGYSWAYEILQSMEVNKHARE